jgi:hypothetical protein
MPGSVPPVADEREGLLAFLEQQRHVLRVAAYGLTDVQVRATPTPSTLSIGGLIKHCVAVERSWMDTVLQREREGAESEYEAGFRVEPGETVADVLALHRRAARETDEIIAGIEDLGQAVPVPRDAPWFPHDIDAWSVRWVLLHLVEETARHAGHADIVREAIDGATAFPLLAAAENWPPTPWLQPWQPPAP